MAPSSSVGDWRTLKPKILRLLSTGRTRKDVIEEISRDGCSITKAQLEYQLKCWGQRTNLSEQAWKYTNYKVHKRARSKKASAVFFNGALIPYEKVVKETRRHDRPTLLPAGASGGKSDPKIFNCHSKISTASPKCPDGFDLVISTPPSSASSPYDSREVSQEMQQSLLDPNWKVSSLPWVKFVRELHRGFMLRFMGSSINIMSLINVEIPTPSQFPVALNDCFKVQQPSFNIMQLDKSPKSLSGWSDSDQTAEVAAISRAENPWASRTFTVIGILIFEISNRLSTGNGENDKTRLSDLIQTLKAVAVSISGLENLLQAGEGPTSRSVIEQLFSFTVTEHDTTLAEMMLQIGADPNQQICDGDPGTCVPALDYAIRHRLDGLTSLLLEFGATCDQMTLKHAVIEGNFDIADRLLHNGSSLDLEFNYIDGKFDVSNATMPQGLQFLKLETVTLPGLVLLDCSRCSCQRFGATLSASQNHAIECPAKDSFTSLEYLFKRGAALSLDTMILASFSVDVVALQLLIQQGGDVRGMNRFGFSCLAAASLREGLQYEVFDLLLRSGATTDIPRSQQEFSSQASPLHWLCLNQRGHDRVGRFELSEILNLIIESSGKLNHRIRHLGSPSQLAEAHERYLWSPSPQKPSLMDHIERAKAESPLECAIIAGNEFAARVLVRRGCQLVGRETKLAAKCGMRLLLEELLDHTTWITEGENIERTCLRLGLRWGHETIVRLLVGRGVTYGDQDMIDALQYPGTLCLSTQTQIELIRATPDLERLQVFGLSLLELCFLKLTADAVRYILRRFPAAYDSGALSATVVRALREVFTRDRDTFRISDIQTMISRRTEHNPDWEKENTALLLATILEGFDVLHLLVTTETARVFKAARLPKKDFDWFLTPWEKVCPYQLMDPTHSLGCQDWVECSPLLGLAVMYHRWTDSSENMLNHLLACSYEPDALTVVVAAAKGNLHLLRRIQCLGNWRRIMSIDNCARPSWCPTALQAAAASDRNGEVVTFLLDAGVSVNEMPAKQPIGEIMPRTALQAAAAIGSLRFIKLFIERGADINAPAAEDSGATALQLACIHGYLEISLRLLELGADINARGALKHGRTALEGAAEHGRIDTIQLLLNHGACTDGPHMVQYLRAVVYAEKNRHFAAAALLRKHREWSTEDEECYKSILSDKLYDE